MVSFFSEGLDSIGFKPTPFPSRKRIESQVSLTPSLNEAVPFAFEGDAFKTFPAGVAANNVHASFSSILTAVLIFFFVSTGCAQKEIPLYTGAMPNSKETADSFRLRDGVALKVSRPTLTLFLPEAGQANGAAVIICPGGGYGALMMQSEGYNTAQYFAKHGVAAFVLKYRLPDDKTMIDKTVGPLQDAQQAIMMVRLNAKEWNIDTARVGIMGFSAGGHLASTASTHFTKAYVSNPSKINLRPAFSVLVYPVISFSEKLRHTGSMTNLLGANPSPENIKLFSNEEQISSATPPAFLIHAADDNVVDVDNSINYFEALRHHGVPGELHVYPKGSHGFVLHLPIEDWMSLVMKWMRPWLQKN
ncbi:MAG: alpha/beta hydrolase [Chitinophagaceae bacterium]